MNIRAKIIDELTIETPPIIYKGIYNFNKSDTLMEKYGFHMIQVVYGKVDKTAHYFPLDKKIDIKKFTFIPCPDPKLYKWNNDLGKWVADLDILKENKKLELRNKADEVSLVFKKPYSQAEQMTWNIQEKGLKDLDADIESHTKEAEWVRALAAERGLSLQEMMEKIRAAIAKADMASLYIVSKQQHLEDDVNAAKTEEEVRAIKWGEDPF